MVEDWREELTVWKKGGAFIWEIAWYPIPSRPSIGSDSQSGESTVADPNVWFEAVNPPTAKANTIRPNLTYEILWNKKLTSNDIGINTSFCSTSISIFDIERVTRNGHSRRRVVRVVFRSSVTGGRSTIEGRNPKIRWSNHEKRMTLAERERKLFLLLLFFTHPVSMSIKNDWGGVPIVIYPAQTIKYNNEYTYHHNPKRKNERNTHQFHQRNQ